MGGVGMSGCNATLNTADGTVVCEFDGPHGDRLHMALGGYLKWHDSVPDACPHQDPTPTYEVREGYCITYGIVPLRWYGSNREGAEAEVRRLVESGEEPENYGAKAWAIRERYESRAEADRYRRALDRIAVYDVPGTGVYRNTDAAEFARRVLDGGDV